MELLEVDRPKEEVLVDVVELHLQKEVEEEGEIAEREEVVQEEEVEGKGEAIEEEETTDLLKVEEDLVHMVVDQDEEALVDIREEEEEKEEMDVAGAGMLSHNLVEVHFKIIFL